MTQFEKDNRKNVLKNFDNIDFAYLQMMIPSWMTKDDALIEQLNQLSHLYLEGRVVWGCVIQANKMLLSENEQWSCPADIVYDPTGMTSLDELGSVASKLYALKNTTPEDPVLAEYAENITGERARVMGRDLPDVITELPLKTSVIFIWRPHLPNGVLQRFFPILISDKTNATTVLPAIFWHKEIYQNWMNNTGFQPNMYCGFRHIYSHTKKLWAKYDNAIKPNRKEIKKLKSAINYSPVKIEQIEQINTENQILAQDFVKQSIINSISQIEEPPRNINKIIFLFIAFVLMILFYIAV